MSDRNGNGYTPKTIDAAALLRLSLPEPRWAVDLAGIAEKLRESAAGEGSGA